MKRRNEPKGPNGEWKTGQRVPENGDYEDQYGVSTFHEVGATFPPCIGRKGECAYRTISQALTA
ncbi:hypothetical protein [Streptomyces sp. NPDC001815]|uniref:hypothetical protein n=1 Tax=Streptomyces sp. NPDC001815 TaxID=3154526 RepID=UPI003317F6A1